jgi:hypothetical protein
MTLLFCGTTVCCDFSAETGEPAATAVVVPTETVVPVLVRISLAQYKTTSSVQNMI